MLLLLHEAHCGVEKSKARARQVIFWPNINDIEKMISTCMVCERYRPQTIKEPLISHTIPHLPYEKIGADICDYGGKSYLVVGCYLTKWMDVVQLRNKSSEEVINKLKPMFPTHGIPKIMICDNVPFSSWEMKKFSKEWCFEIITSSPRYPKSNGFAEKLVGIAKSLLRKAGPEKLYEALLEYRCTPISGMSVSPSQMLLSRKLRTKLPITQTELQPVVHKHFREGLIKKRARTKLYHDKQAHVRPEFISGEKVMVRVGTQWEPAVIVKKHSTPRSYLVKNKNGRIVRRNKCHIRKTNIQTSKELNPDYHDLGDEWNICGNNTQDNGLYHSNNNPVNLNRNTSHTTSQNGYLYNNNSASSNPVYITRRGRNVNRPSRYDDYLL
ncbi:Uncharacterized protein K02A2.6 [Araneus ventricosus]|uniref:RNA-directed DNA polymerase n=1 Tax=Araneus ventricosus TaxID=182803 RepID=A0A4Y2VLA8_ARAVE|nr:Uncharacterized protein K02A2.6 [Araneus ventricosus]